MERIHSLNEEEQRLVFDRRLQIFQRIHEWREENERLGLEPAISDFWTPEQRQRFLNEWSDDSYIIEASRGEKRTYDEMMSEKPSTSHQGALQTGRGEGDEGDNERPFYIESVRQVYTKKFKTNATSYRGPVPFLYNFTKSKSLLGRGTPREPSGDPEGTLRQPRGNPHIHPTSTPHPPYIHPTSTLHPPPTSAPHPPYIDPTSTLHRPHIDLTSTPHRPT